MWIYIVLAIVALVVLILLSPVIIRVSYDNDTLEADARFYFIKRSLLTDKKLLKKNKKKKAKAKVKTNIVTQKTTVSGWQDLRKQLGTVETVKLMISSTVTFFQSILRLVKGARVRNLELEIRVTGEDAADAAIHYGEVCAVLYPFLGAVDNHMRLIRPKLNLYCDYAAEKPLVRGKAKIYISLYHVVGTTFYNIKQMVLKQI